MKDQYTCKKKHDVQVLQSAAGFYIGTHDEYGPYCRVSSQYWPNREDAESALENKTYLERDSVENLFCNDRCGCCIRKKVII